MATTVNSTPAELIAMAEAVRELERSYDAAHPPMPMVHVPTRSRIEFKDGQMTSDSDAGATRVAVPGQAVAKGFVKLSNGTITTIEAAEAGGVLDLAVEYNREDLLSGFKKGSPHDMPAAAPKPETNEATLVDVTEGDRAKITKASEALMQASEAVGATAVAAYQQDVAVSGELPTELPEGISAEIVNAVAAGYVAQANTVLRDTGATVDTLTTFLNDTELKEARLATFRGDDTKLRQLGGLAITRLLLLPDDPVLLKELTANWPKDIRVTMRGDAWWVESPNENISWADAVRNGAIRLQ